MIAMTICTEQPQRRFTLDICNVHTTIFSGLPEVSSISSLSLFDQKCLSPTGAGSCNGSTTLHVPGMIISLPGMS